MGAITKTTKRASGSNPVWNEDFEFPLDYCQGQSLTVDVFDSDKLSEDELLGSLDIHRSGQHTVRDIEGALV